MDGERLQRKTFLLRLLHHQIGDAIERCSRHRRIGGLQLEAISYPKGMAYEKDASTILWTPKDPAK